MGTEDTHERTYGGLRDFTHRVLIVAAIAIVFLFLWQIARALLFIFISILLAVLWRGLAGLVTRLLPTSIRWGLLLVAMLSLGLIALFIWFAGARINEQLSQLIQTLPNSINNLKQTLAEYAWARYLLEYIVPSQLNSGQQISLVSRVTGAASTAATVLVDMVVVLFMTIYFAVDPDVYVRGILSLVPKNKYDRIRDVFDASSQTLQHWLLGQALAMIIVGTLTAVGLWVAGVPLAFVLGVIASALDFVPYLGPIAAAVPGTLIALSRSPMTAVYALIVYLIVHQLENHVVVPLVQKETVWLPPALVILAVVVFGLLFGLLGLLVATPLTAVVVVWIKMLYVHDILHKPTDPG
ncbi:MAG: AI-2E family transporter [Solirubrobacterales bacterium]